MMIWFYKRLNTIFRTISIVVFTILFLTACPEDQDTPQQQPKNEALFDGIDSKIIYSHGPLKKMMPEQYLSALSEITGHNFGSYDFVTQSNQGQFQNYCESLGGCPDHVTRFRSQDMGMVQTITLDEIANRACISDRGATGMIPPDVNINDQNPADEEIEAAIIWQYRRIIGSSPDAFEATASKDYFDRHLGYIDAYDLSISTAADETNNHDFETALRNHCFALVTSSKFIYY